MQPILPYFFCGSGWLPHRGCGRCLPRPLRVAAESAFRAHYDGVGAALAQLMESKQPQERQLGQALINLEYENLMTALRLALAQKQPFWNIYSSPAEYLRSRQGFREEKKQFVN
ncbi:MAG: hypothetical protein H6660_11335 [Ardenticatenaceae bacterium]|nr:hypothetical protein [Ardenticatenaceae bacterium]